MAMCVNKTLIFYLASEKKKPGWKIIEWNPSLLKTNVYTIYCIHMYM